MIIAWPAGLPGYEPVVGLTEDAWWLEGGGVYDSQIDSAAVLEFVRCKIDVYLAERCRW